jgi:thioredoxin reductase/ferredoxin
MDTASVMKLAAYGLPMLLIWGVYGRRRARTEKVSVAAKEAAVETGMIEPASLHPLIDPARCIGCGSCVAACPEQPEHHVLGLIAGKVQLVSPADCIGHGACRLACPVGAITLVFGTERRGVDIPLLSPGFETNVPGIFIAGELGGMGLIRNAIEQGVQAMESIRKLGGIGKGQRLDVLIVGAGPAGIAATLAARQHRLRSRTIEQDTLGGTVAHFPRGKVVMTAPVRLPGIGRVRFTETTKEELLGFWQGVEKKAGLAIAYNERLEVVTPKADGFVVRTSRGSYETRALLLAIGRRGTPRKLGVAGEELNKVVYRLIDPAQYRGQKVLVVGGGDSALEAAAGVAEEPGTEVTLSYRSPAFNRAKQKNRARVEALSQSRRLRVLMSSNVKLISPDKVRLEQQGRQVEIDNDAVIVCAGGILPTPLLREIGIEVETKHGTA